jgi:hypothetical protein
MLRMDWVNDDNRWCTFNRCSISRRVAMVLPVFPRANLGSIPVFFYRTNPLRVEIWEIAGRAARDSILEMEFNWWINPAGDDDERLGKAEDCELDWNECHVSRHLTRIFTRDQIMESQQTNNDGRVYSFWFWTKISVICYYYDQDDVVYDVPSPPFWPPWIAIPTTCITVLVLETSLTFILMLGKQSCPSSSNSASFSCAQSQNPCQIW